MYVEIKSLQQSGTWHGWAFTVEYHVFSGGGAVNCVV